MRYEIIQTAEFTRKAIKAGLALEDVPGIENDIMVDPSAFPVMAGTNGLRKMRFAPASMNTGKSGGLRVCYFVVDSAAHVWLVTLFAKNEAPNLTKKDRRDFAVMIAALKKAAGYKR